MRWSAACGSFLPPYPLSYSIYPWIEYTQISEVQLNQITTQHHHVKNNPQISEAQRNQIIGHIRRYSQVVPRGPLAPSEDGSERFSFDDPAVDEVGGSNQLNVQRKSIDF